MVYLAVAVVCAAIGLVALPFTFSTSALSAAAWARPAWLVAALVVAVVLLALFPRLSRWLAAAIDREAPSATPSQTRLVSQIVVAGVMLVLVQAMLRRPVALVVSDERGSITYEAAIAATALTLVLALLVWLYQSGRTLLQTVTLRAIDSAFPTVAPAPETEPTRTVSVTSASAISEPTVRAPVVQAEATQRVADGDPTIRVADGPTVVTRRAIPDPEATIASESDATLRNAAEPEA